MNGAAAQSSQAAASQGCSGALQRAHRLLRDLARGGEGGFGSGAALGGLPGPRVRRAGQRLFQRGLDCAESAELYRYLASAIRPARLAWPPKRFVRSSMNFSPAADSSRSKIASIDGITDQDPFAFGCSHSSGDRDSTLLPKSPA